MPANPLSLPGQFRMARHVFLVAAPVGALVGVAIAAYDYVVNVLLWERFVHHFSPLVLCLLPIAGMFLTGLILQVFRVPWVVRSQPTLRPSSVYTVWAVALMALIWFMRGWFVRVHDDR